jgi:hypothetical protein
MDVRSVNLSIDQRTLQEPTEEEVHHPGREFRHIRYPVMIGPQRWEDAPVMTPNNDIIASRNGTNGVGGKSMSRLNLRARSRTSNRVRSLLSVVLRRPNSQARTLMSCQYCELTGGPFAPGEAALLLTVHEQLHHGGLSMHRPVLPPALPPMT